MPDHSTVSTTPDAKFGESDGESSRSHQRKTIRKGMVDITGHVIRVRSNNLTFRDSQTLQLSNFECHQSFRK